jgi:hypothetical protein
VRRGQQAMSSIPVSIAAASTAITETPAIQASRLAKTHKDAVEK